MTTRRRLAPRSIGPDCLPPLRKADCASESIICSLAEPCQCVPCKNTVRIGPPPTDVSLVERRQHSSQRTASKAAVVNDESIS